MWQHCLVDVSPHSTKLWATARRIKHVLRAKHGGILTVAFDEHRRLVIERTIAKWRNSALRYRAVRNWRYASAFLRQRSEACGPSAAEHLPRGCSTCASGTSSARCERWSRPVDSNRVQAPRTRRAFHRCPLWQMALSCAKALTHRQLCRAVRSWRDVLYRAQSFSMELEQGQSARLRLGFAGPVSMTLRGFSDQMDAAETSGSESAAPAAHPLPGASRSPRLETDRDLPMAPSPPRHSVSIAAGTKQPPD